MKRRITLVPRPSENKKARSGDFLPFGNLMEDTFSSLSLSSPKPKENYSSKGKVLGRRSSRLSQLRLKSDSPRNQPKSSFVKSSQIRRSLSNISNKSTEITVKSESTKVLNSAQFGLPTNVKSNVKTVGV